MIELHLGDQYDWSSLVSSIDWTLIDTHEKVNCKIDAFHPLQPCRDEWKSISDTWPSDYTVAQLKQQTAWDEVEPLHCDSTMSCLSFHYSIEVDLT